MKLARWQIVFARMGATDKTGHPVVLLSGPDLMNDPRQLRFNGLVGTKRPPAAPVLVHQVLLDQADGLEFSTLLNCAVVFVLRREDILRDAGVVSYVRRAEIAMKVRASLGLW